MKEELQKPIGAGFWNNTPHSDVGAFVYHLIHEGGYELIVTRKTIRVFPETQTDFKVLCNRLHRLAFELDDDFGDENRQMLRDFEILEL